MCALPVLEILVYTPVKFVLRHGFGPGDVLFAGGLPLKVVMILRGVNNLHWRLPSAVRVVSVAQVVQLAQKVRYG